MSEFLSRENAPKLAYVATDGDDSFPTVMFLGGFRSDMEGTKAIYLEEQCKRRKQKYVRFDYRGHGKSEGIFEESCISEWAQDAIDILDQCTSGPVILVGSSMGGWISLLAAIEKPDRVKAIVGLAAAPDFTQWMEAGMDESQKNSLEKEGFFALPNDYDEPYIITKKLLEDGRQRSLLQGEIKIDIPVRLIQGMKDTDVEWQTAHRIKNAITGDDVEVILLENADHRLSDPDQLSVLNEILGSLL